MLACTHLATPEPLPRASPMRVLTSGLDAPWAIVLGPDGWLWITERKGKRVTRIDTRSGARQVALVLPAVLQTSGQDGLLGLALHPRLLRGTGEDFAYLAYTYDAGASRRRVQIVRYRYNPQEQTLEEPEALLTNLPASTDHNSGRLRYGPDERLYYAIGDQGKNQYDHMCEPNQAQQLPTAAQVAARDWSAYEGKVLRIALDGTIPSDNPHLAGVQSHVFSYGHRNVQGLAFAGDGKLYASEHGPKTDDELNLLRSGGNYGWPHVAGYRDDKAYVYGNWSAAAPEPCSALRFADFAFPSAVPQQRESAWAQPFIAPLTTLYTVDSLAPSSAPECAGNVCWPTVAPSSLTSYQAHGRTALLVPSLKEGSVLRLRLDASGEAVVGGPERLVQTKDRYRDLTLSPNQQTLYVLTDSEPMTSGPTKATTQQLAHRGAVLVFPFSP
jgi:PQQ-dependent dehydrogenase (s-GDH family)